jgi:uncharacterized membrane protein YjjB (DUF3815 family)
MDLIDNYVPMSLARLGLATSILLASAAGILVGVELTLPDPTFATQVGGADNLSLLADMVLAGIVTCGFAVFYNTTWQHVGMAILGGMTSHGLRFLALEAGNGLQAATFLGGLSVGALSAWMARSRMLPVAIIAFAGAVTMIPGLNLYRALVGMLQLARLADTADAGMVARTLSNALQGTLVVGALTLGLIMGARGVLALARTREQPPAKHNVPPTDETARQVPGGLSTTQQSQAS